MSLPTRKRNNPLFGMSINDIYHWGINESINPKKRQKKEPKIAEADNEESISDIAQNEEGSFEDIPVEKIELNDIEKPRKPKSKEILAQLKQERINHIRKEKNIYTYGSDIPPLVETFEQLKSVYNVEETLIRNLRSQGFDTPTPIQMQTWSLMFDGRELLACAPTGSGKTAGFLVPIIHKLQGPKKKGFRAVIVAPTQELAKQTYRECLILTEGIGLITHTLYDTSKLKDKFGPNSSKKFDILVTTPNRLVFMLQEDPPMISLSKVEWLIVDESDRLFEDGHKGFRDQLAVIFQACNNANVKRGMFSATFANDVEEWCKLNLNNLAMVTVGARNSACKDVKQELMYCGDEYGKHFALFNILRKGYDPPCLIFVQTKERAKQLFKDLLLDNRMAAAIHSDRPLFERENLVKAFRERKIWILVCTELLARGIDFKGVNLVINYDFPPSIRSYIHRVGRTGRAGQPGRAITFWTMVDKPLVRSVAQLMQGSGSEAPDWLLKMKKVGRFKKSKYTKELPDRGFVSEASKHEHIMKEEKQKRRNKKRTKRKVENNDDKEKGGDTPPDPPEGSERKKKKKKTGKTNFDQTEGMKNKKTDSETNKKSFKERLK